MLKKTAAVVVLLLSIMLLHGVMGHAGPKISVEVLDKTDSNDRIGKNFIQQINKRLQQAGKFEITGAGAARVIIRVETLRVPELPYTSIFSVTWMARTTAGAGSIFLDQSLGLISEAHLGKDAEDIVALTAELSQKLPGK
jgi:hypothetical protein